MYLYIFISFSSPTWLGRGKDHVLVWNTCFSLYVHSRAHWLIVCSPVCSLDWLFFNQGSYHDPRPIRLSIGQFFLEIGDKTSQIRGKSVHLSVINDLRVWTRQRHKTKSQELWSTDDSSCVFSSLDIGSSRAMEPWTGYSLMLLLLLNHNTSIIAAVSTFSLNHILFIFLLFSVMSRVCDPSMCGNPVAAHHNDCKTPRYNTESCVVWPTLRSDNVKSRAVWPKSFKGSSNSGTKAVKTTDGFRVWRSTSILPRFQEPFSSCIQVAGTFARGPHTVEPPHLHFR